MSRQIAQCQNYVHNLSVISWSVFSTRQNDVQCACLYRRQWDALPIWALFGGRRSTTSKQCSTIIYCLRTFLDCLHFLLRFLKPATQSHQYICLVAAAFRINSRWFIHALICAGWTFRQCNISEMSGELCVGKIFILVSNKLSHYTVYGIFFEGMHKNKLVVYSVLSLTL